jgi:hypothetical protein
LHSRQQIKDALGKYLDGQVARASASAKPVNRGVVVPDASLAAVLARDGSSAAISRSEVLEMLLASAFEPWWRLERDGVLVAEKCVVIALFVAFSEADRPSWRRTQTRRDADDRTQEEEEGGA